MPNWLHEDGIGGSFCCPFFLENLEKSGRAGLADAKPRAAVFIRTACKRNLAILSYLGCMAKNSKIYPGEMATPVQLKALADEYLAAARLLQQLGRRGQPLSRAPFRLAAIHAIELYLNALLLNRGRTASQIRAMQHNLAMRAKEAEACGLRLRKRTIAHLENLGASQEYLVTRYGPEMTGTASQINRLNATLDEVAGKVSALL
ncbi:MAG: hypothetical protein ACI9KA_002130 [Parasphingorhabdus sp.]|jgi:hypothetical protein|uniref:hypothetical protein n=1 Tax=Parasphingorhabdus sp. TaxID=2709688 RepID=UPI0039E5AE06